MCYTNQMVRTKEQANVLNGKCPSQQVLGLVADRWSALAIYCLSKGTRRNSDLMRQIGGVSQKMLTQTLRRLEQNGIVSRKVYPVTPPHVEYSLTALGASLTAPLKTLCEWAQNHMGEVQRARARHQQQEEKRDPVAEA